MIFQNLKASFSSPVAALALLVALDFAVAGCSTGPARSSRLATPPDPPPVPRAKPVVPSTWMQTASQATFYLPQAAPAASSQPGSQRVHVITEGQSLYAVARLYGTTVGDLIQTNQLAPPYKLALGQRLAIPGAYPAAPAPQPIATSPAPAQPVPTQAAHVVESGDTVYSIARRYQVDMADLVRLNGISASYNISPGQRLLLPGQALAVAGLLAATGTKLSSAAAAPAAQPTAQATPAAWTQTYQATVAMVPPPEITGPIPNPPPRAGSKFLWPVEGKLLTGYGPKNDGLHNDGINIAAPRGSPVRAADNGVVAYVGNELRGFGNLLLIKHADGWMTAYAHNEAILVGRGARVSRGQTVARVGDSGNVVTPQLHFEVRRGTRAVDPTKQLGPSQAAQNW